jgi:D-alanyl-lipoteichoic acid acyltransferase DltB (MBOAT superfamily)
MLFHSFEYLVFLWGVYVLYWTTKNRRPLRHAIVLVASYWFYSRADWRFTSLLAISTVCDYVAGGGIQRARDAGRDGAAKAWMALSLCVNLGLLGVFKYFDFFASSFNALAESWGLGGRVGLLHVALPVGISFYTFQTLSYTIDIYRGRFKPVRSLLDFALYVSFFPQLVAGPIVRARDFLPQLEAPPVLSSSRVSSGLFQILRGMTKKLLMADILGAHVVDLAFRDAATIGELSGPALLFATYAYALQLYGDFAGYTDIAIGSARILGLELTKNFDAPYRSSSLEDFWRRWHITMSSWFSDYVYVGLGGSRKGLLRACLNVLVAWTLVGLWHGAAWTFVLWGVYHGLWLAVVRLARAALPGGRFPLGALAAPLGWLFTFHVVAFSMILFRCPDMETFWAACRALTDWSGVRGGALPLDPAANWQVWTILLLGYATHLFPGDLAGRLETAWIRTPRLVQGTVLAGAIVIFFGLHPPGLAPFIYFQF